MSTMICRILACTAALTLAASARASDPLVVAQGAGAEACRQPQALVAGDGTVHLVYGAGDTVYHTRSTDGVATFTPPRQAFRVPNLALGSRRGPRIALAGKTLVVTAIGGLEGKGRDGDLLAWRSNDGGETWLGPVRVNDVADSAREGLHGMAADADGSAWCVWLDLREKRMEVFLSKSLDGGETWNSNVRVYRSPDGNVCECCHPSIVVGAGKVHVMFRNSLAGLRDMHLVASTDEGATFGSAAKLGLGNWKLAACPMDGGMLALDSRGSVVTVWRRDNEVFCTSGNDGREQRLGRGVQPWIATTANGPVIVWTDRRDGDLWLMAPGTNEPRKLASTARDPIVVSAISGNGPVVACWESKRDGESAVLAIRIEMTPQPARTSTGQ